jgi:hypothetical protein
LWISDDLATWRGRSFDTGNPRAGIISVAYGGGLWLASGGRSSVVNGRYRGEALAGTSIDGLDWQPVALRGRDSFHVAHGDGIWIAANVLGEYRTSRDGLAFEEVAPTGAWGRLVPDVRVRFEGGRFLTFAVDDAGAAPTVNVIQTRDGLVWRDFGAVADVARPDGALRVEHRIEDVAYGDCRYVAAGVYTIQVPGALDPPPFASEIGPLLITAALAAP